MKVPRIRKISRAFGNRIQRDRSKKIILGKIQINLKLKLSYKDKKTLKKNCRINPTDI
jgi:hypothetical protein